MNNKVARIAEMRHFDELAEHICSVCQNSKKHCLHSWTEGDSATLSKDLKELFERSELCYVYIAEDGNIVGSIGCEYDSEMGRGWIQGPHLLTNSSSESTDILFTKLLSLLPASIEDFRAFPNTENIFLQDFFQSKGFSKNQHYDHTYTLDRTPTFSSEGISNHLLLEEEVEAFTRLYEEIFPAAYYSADRIIEMRNNSHEIIVSSLRGSITGFAIVKHGAKNSAGEIEFLGVDKQHRNKGLGGSLLRDSVNLLFQSQDTEVVKLTVTDTLSQARNLYESAGFRLKFTGRGLSYSIK